MNTQIQRGLAEIERLSASEWQVRAKGKADFRSRVLRCHLPNCTEVEKALTRAGAQPDP